MASKFCCVPGCDEELSEHARLDECRNCRASMGVWRKRGISAILERRRKLEKYDSRMELISKPKAVDTPKRKISGGRR